MRFLLIVIFLISPIFANATLVVTNPQPECWRRQQQILKDMESAVTALNNEAYIRATKSYQSNALACVEAENLVFSGTVTTSDFEALHAYHLKMSGGH